MSFQAVGTGSGVHRLFPFCLPYIGVFLFTLHMPLDFIRVSSLRPTYMYLHPLDRPFTWWWWVSKFGTGSGTRCCDPKRRSMGCAWSRHVVSNFCPITINFARDAGHLPTRLRSRYNVTARLQTDIRRLHLGQCMRSSRTSRDVPNCAYMHWGTLLCREYGVETPLRHFTGVICDDRLSVKPNRKKWYLIFVV